MFLLRSFKDVFLVFGVITLLLCSAGQVVAADGTSLAKQIQKSLSPVKRHIVTEPRKAAKELSETMALFEQLRQTDPANTQIPLLEKQIEKYNKQLSKRLGHEVKPVAKPASPPPSTPKATPPPAVKPTPPPVQAGSSGNTATKLPSAVQSRIKKIDKSLNKAKQALGKNSTQRARMELKTANKTYAEILKRYQEKAPASHSEMVALSARIVSVTAQVEGAENAKEGQAVAGKKAAADNQALADSWIMKMNPYTKRDGAKYLDQTGWNKDSEDFARIRTHYGEAAGIMAEYRKVNFPLGKPMQLQNSENALQTALDNLKETYAKEDTAKASEAWLSKLQPYVTSMGDKTLIVSFSSSVEDMTRQKKIYDEASALFAQYQKSQFPQGKSPQMQQVEVELADRLAKFPETYQRSLAAQSGNAEEKLNQEIAFLETKSEWKKDTNKKPYCLSDDRIEGAQKLVDTAVNLLPQGSQEAAQIQNKMATLIQMNNERRKVNAARTFMNPDIFAGDGKKGIKEKAESLVRSKIAGCTVLRTTTISEDWKEETVKEWTDTTKTATRIRTTRSVTAQVAAKKSNGNVRLFTLHVAKDLRSDGSWGKLYGNLHSDQGDLMLEKNVRK